jgi:predicted glutamine amidotransferase
MCRILLIRSEDSFEVQPHLEAFAAMCRSSSEYQGDGWGMVVVNGVRGTVRHPTPIWEHDFSCFGPARLLMVHARSAFSAHPLGVDHNMPFIDPRYCFAFNGELHGVQLNAEGDTGAAKIFSLFRRLDHGDAERALQRTVQLLEKRSRHIRACNLVLTDGDHAWAYARSTDEPDYFTMHAARGDGMVAVSSAPLDNGLEWRAMPHDTVEVVA